MKDRVFSGEDVTAALTSAAATLGLPASELRYVVLDQGSEGGRGLGPTPARIAVLFGDPAPAGTASPRPDRGEPRRAADERPLPAPDVRAEIEALVGAVAHAGGLEVAAEIIESEDALILQLRGPDAAFFHGPEGRGEILHALDHLLQRTHGQRIHPLALRVRCEGYREARDEALAEEARRLAAVVRADREARTMDPLNAYERRIVHLTLQDAPGIRTFSVGEGRDRRVTVAPADATREEEAGDGH